METNRVLSEDLRRANTTKVGSSGRHGTMDASNLIALGNDDTENYR